MKTATLSGFYTSGDIGGTDQSNDCIAVGIEHRFWDTIARTVPTVNPAASVHFRHRPDALRPWFMENFSSH